MKNSDNKKFTVKVSTMIDLWKKLKLKKDENHRFSIFENILNKNTKKDAKVKSLMIEINNYYFSTQSRNDSLFSYLRLLWQKIDIQDYDCEIEMNYDFLNRLYKFSYGHLPDQHFFDQLKSSESRAIIAKNNRIFIFDNSIWEIFFYANSVDDGHGGIANALLTIDKEKVYIKNENSDKANNYVGNMEFVDAYQNYILFNFKTEYHSAKNLHIIASFTLDDNLPEIIPAIYSNIDMNGDLVSGSLFMKNIESADDFKFKEFTISGETPNGIDEEIFSILKKKSKNKIKVSRDLFSKKDIINFLDRQFYKKLYSSNSKIYIGFPIEIYTENSRRKNEILNIVQNIKDQLPDSIVESLYNVSSLEKYNELKNSIHNKLKNVGKAIFFIPKETSLSSNVFLEIAITMHLEVAIWVFADDSVWDEDNLPLLLKDFDQHPLRRKLKYELTSEIPWKSWIFATQRG